VADAEAAEKRQEDWICKTGRLTEADYSSKEPIGGFGWLIQTNIFAERCIVRNMVW